MADQKITDLSENTAVLPTDQVELLDDPGGTPANQKATTANVVAGALGTTQLVNEIKNWPTYTAMDIDLAAANLWWDSEGTPSTAPTMVDVAGESITETWEYCLKVVADGANEGLSQTWTYADEPRVKAGAVLSAMVAIWSVSSLSVTAKLVNSDASHTDASAVTAAAWTIVRVENHTLAGSSCKLTVTAAGAGTFYVVPLGACIGPKAYALGPRPILYRQIADNTLVNNVDPGGGSWTDVDCTAATSALAYMANVYSAYRAAGGGFVLMLRPNGDAGAGNTAAVDFDATDYGRANTLCYLDDGQVMEYDTNAGAATAESLFIIIQGYWEWA